MADRPATIGVPTLDEQHRAMAGMLRAFLRAIAQCQPVVEVQCLVDHAMAALCAHCRYEEAVMAEICDPDAAVHRFDHERLVMASVAFTEDALHHRLPLDVLHEHGAILRELFLAHVDHYDRALAGHLLRWGESEATASGGAVVGAVEAFTPMVSGGSVLKQ